MPAATVSIAPRYYNVQGRKKGTTFSWCPFKNCVSFPDIIRISSIFLLTSVGSQAWAWTLHWQGACCHHNWLSSIRFHPLEQGNSQLLWRAWLCMCVRGGGGGDGGSGNKWSIIWKFLNIFLGENKIILKQYKWYTHHGCDIYKKQNYQHILLFRITAKIVFCVQHMACAQINILIWIKVKAETEILSKHDERGKGET